MYVYLLFFNCFFPQGWSYRTNRRRTTGEDSIGRKDKKIGGQLDPPPRPFFPKSSDQNFEIAVLFSIIHFVSPYPMGKSFFSYGIHPFFTHCICFGKFAYIFRMKARVDYLFEDFSRWNFSMGMEIPGVNFSGKFYTGEFPMRNSFYLFSFLFAESIVGLEMLRVTVTGEFLKGLNWSTLQDFSIGRGIFSVEVNPEFSGIFKKSSETKFKNNLSFFQLKAKVNIKIENEQELLCIRRGLLSRRHFILYAKVWILGKILVEWLLAISERG